MYVKNKSSRTVFLSADKVSNMVSGRTILGILVREPESF